MSDEAGGQARQGRAGVRNRTTARRAVTGLGTRR
jgi:hypothetical protein